MEGQLVSQVGLLKCVTFLIADPSQYRDILSSTTGFPALSASVIEGAPSGWINHICYFLELIFSLFLLIFQIELFLTVKQLVKHNYFEEYLNSSLKQSFQCNCVNKNNQFEYCLKSIAKSGIKTKVVQVRYQLIRA